MTEYTDNVVEHPAVKHAKDRDRLEHRVHNEMVLIGLPDVLDKLADDIRRISMEQGLKLREDTALGEEIQQFSKLAKGFRRRIRKKVASLYGELADPL